MTLPLAGAVLSAACWPAALSPLATKADRTPPTDLFGNWVDADDPKEHVSLRAKPGTNDGTFLVEFSEGANEEGDRQTQTVVFEARATTLSAGQFWDLVPVPEKDDDPPVVPYLLRPHYFLRIDVEDGTLVLRWLDPEWLAAQAEAGLPEAALVELDDHLVLTAETEALRGWLSAEGGNTDAFARDTLRYLPAHRLDSPLFLPSLCSRYVSYPANRGQGSNRSSAQWAYDCKDRVYDSFQAVNIQNFFKRSWF
jgi:hypothetical protein